MIIKMVDPTKQYQSIHNQPTSIKIASIFIDKDDFYINVIEQDIIDETKKR